MDIDKEITYGVTLEGLVDAVNSIEADIFEQTGCEYYNVIVISNGFTTLVEFLGNRIWCDEDEGDREFSCEDNGEVVAYEPIEDYLRRAIMEEIGKLSKVKLLVERDEYNILGERNGD